jgi:hypothetical protein
VEAIPKGQALTDPEHDSPLHVLIKKNMEKERLCLDDKLDQLIKWFVENRPEGLNQIDRWHYTPLRYALRYHEEDFSLWLLKAYFKRAARGQKDFVKCGYLDNKLDYFVKPIRFSQTTITDYSIESDVLDAGDWSLFSYTVQYEYTKILQWLETTLTLNKDPAFTKYYFGALRYAIQEDKKDIIRLLSRQLMNQYDDNGWTVLHFLIIKEKKEELLYVIEHMQNNPIDCYTQDFLAQKDKVGNTLRDYAAMKKIDLPASQQRCDQNYDGKYTLGEKATEP